LGLRFTHNCQSFANKARTSDDLQGTFHNDCSLDLVSGVLARWDDHESPRLSKLLIERPRRRTAVDLHRLHLPLAAQSAPAHAKPGGIAVQAGAGGSPAVGAASAASAAPAAAIRPVPPATQHGILRGHKVLIVDDDPRNAFVLTDVLEMHGVIVVQATDGRKAITELAAGDIDLVLMDVMMPRMDGYETTRAIRRMPEFASLPVITVTARAMQGDREKSIDAGASDYITKPIDIEELLNRMERWLAPDADRTS